MKTTLFDLSDRLALVTGATQGLGWAIACALAGHGARLLLTDRDPSALAQAVDRLNAQGAQVRGHVADLTSPVDVAGLCDAAGPVDVLVCNAGIPGPAGPLGQAAAADWDRVLQVNLRSTAQLTAGLLPGMADRGHGSVVLMSSIAGLRGNRSIGLYGISKAALAQLARNLAVEWGPAGVRVNAVSPGLIHTPLAYGLMDDPAFMQRRLQATPLRRVGVPDEIAGVVVMLASRAGGFITGQNLVIDGGTLIHDGS